MDMNTVLESIVDDVPELASGDSKRELAKLGPTLEQTIERARLLVSQYEIRRVVVRDVRGGKARDLVRDAKPPSSRRHRRRTRRAP